jgi:hypothetical protein
VLTGAARREDRYNKGAARLDSALDRGGAADPGQDARGDAGQRRLRILGRWMRMITIPNQASVAKAHEQFDEAGRMPPSPYYDRLVDVMEELMKFTYLTRGASDYLTSRYSPQAGLQAVCDAILTRAAKRSNSTASRRAV